MSSPCGDCGGTGLTHVWGDLERCYRCDGCGRVDDEEDDDGEPDDGQIGEVRR